MAGLEKSKAVIRTKSPRNPTTYDYLAFYVGIPMLFGIVATPFAAVPMGVVESGNIALYAYVCFRAVVFWVITDLCCRCVGHCLTKYRLPLWAIFSIGFSGAAITIYVFVYVALMASRMKNPSIAPLIGHENMGWNASYFMTVAGYAVPAFLVWVTSAYGYMRIFNVALFSYARTTEDESADQPGTSPADSATRRPGDTRTPTFLINSNLPNDARVIAIKAEEHYIKLWTDRGTDMQRYRFKDAVNELSASDGLQVHRSWWIHLPSVEDCRLTGRKMEVVMADHELTVPVSMSYKQPLRRALEVRESHATAPS